VVNKAFAAAEPEKVKGLTAGIIEGNILVRENPDPYLDVIAKAFTKKDAKPEDKWDRARAKAELQKIHLSNGPENLAFFGGAMDAAGSFAGIYQTAVYSYGSELVKNPVDSEQFANTKYLKELDAAGAFKDQKVAIAPIKTGSGGGVEADPLLSKNIRFLFQPNVAVLEVSKDENLKNLSALKQMLQVSPGSEILLRGHVDDANKAAFLKSGGEQYVRQKAVEAMSLSRERAEEIRQQLIKREKIDPNRIKVVGRGWEEPLGKNGDENRRVEAQWFTLE
jgi:NitT/TauT family transport system substrate-binding protein